MTTQWRWNQWCMQDGAMLAPSSTAHTIRKNSANQGKLGEKSGFWSIFSGTTLIIRVNSLIRFESKLISSSTNIRVSLPINRKSTLIIRLFQNKYSPLTLGFCPYDQTNSTNILMTKSAESPLTLGFLPYQQAKHTNEQAVSKQIFTTNIRVLSL